MKDCDENVSCSGRREFLVRAAFLTGGIVIMLSGASTIFGKLAENLTITIGADSPLAKIGGSEVVDSAAGKIIVLRTGEKSFMAFSARCTHKGGTVALDAASNKFVCPKHGSKFDSSTGAVAEGPAKDALTGYNAKGDTSSVVISVG